MSTRNSAFSGSAAPRPAGHPWDEAANGWNRHSALIRAWLSGITSDMLDKADIAPGARVLDIAAGAGDQTIDIALRAGKNGHVLAVDISPRILALARENFLAAGVLNVETVVGDAQALGLAGANFDAAVCRLGLMFCESPALALREIRSALRPQGRFSTVVFSNPSANPCLVTVSLTARRHAGLPDPDPVAPGSLMSLGKPGAMEKILLDAGFIDIEVQPRSAPFHFASGKDYIEFIRTSGSPIIEILKPLSAHKQAAAWEDMAVQLDRYSTSAGWEGPNELLLCSASAGAAC